MAKKTDLNKETISPDLVAYSRVGDTFHYRWAARRCLYLLDFNSGLEYITIEGSKEPRLAGEYVIDTAEYRTDRSQSMLSLPKSRFIHNQICPFFPISNKRSNCTCIDSYESCNLPLILMFNISHCTTN